jgi:rod shape-determining protein MreC
MRNLFQFLWRNNFLLLFLLLEGACVYLMAENNNYHNASVLNSSNKLTATIYGGVNYVTEYIYLKENNHWLADENVKLRMQLASARKDTSVIRTVVKDTVFNQQYIFIHARAINNTVTKRNNYLTLDKGSAAGIAPEMGVVTANGIVGIVKDVSPNFSTVISFLHIKSKVSARFKNSNYFGSLVWEDDNNASTATLKDIPKHVMFKTGDSLVTTSFSNLYPENIFLGTVKHSEIKPGDNFYTITVKLSTDFYSLTHVYVVKDLLKNEQQKLEAAQNGN